MVCRRPSQLPSSEISFNEFCVKRKTGNLGARKKGDFDKGSGSADCGGEDFVCKSLIGGRQD
jgi:hypothetical protein